MNVTQALQRRMSVRAFCSDSVPERLVRELLSLAACAPSGGNLQPWRVYVLAGEPLAGLKQIMRERAVSDHGEQPEYAVYPAKLWDPFRQRRRAAGALRYAALGTEDRNADAQRQMVLNNVAFFGAPVGLFFCLDRRFGPPQWSDLGMYMQSLMLLAVERGLDTCPQEVWANWPDTLRAYLQMDAGEMLFAGMSLGYRDRAHPLNAMRTERAKVDEFASLRGFSEAAGRPAL